MIGSRSVDDLHPAIRDRAVRLRSAMFTIGPPVLITSTYRSLADQEYLYAQGRTRPGRIVTNAKPGSSPHNVVIRSGDTEAPASLAFDICFGTPLRGSLTSFSRVTWDGPWGLVAAIGKHIGLAWGGDWQKPDRPHFYHPEWRDLAREAGVLS